MKKNGFSERVDYEAKGNKFQVYIHKKRYQLARKYVSRTDNILDIGCGLGWGTDWLSLASNSVIGLDTCENALRVARSRYKGPVFVKADATELPFGDQSFHTVVAIEVIEHVKNQDAFMSEVLRVLKQDGTLILSTPNKRNLVARIANLFGIEVQKNPYHTNEFDYKTLDAFLTASGLEIVYKSGLYLPLIPPLGRYMVKLVESGAFYKLLFRMGMTAPGLARFSFAVCKKL